MQMVQEGYQMTLDDLGIWSGKMCREHSAVRRGRISGRSCRKSSGSQTVPVMCLDLTPGAGNLLGLPFWENDAAWLGECWTLNTGESPREESVSLLSWILQADVPEKYYLSAKACRGILTRASRRGKKLQELLETALLEMIEWWQRGGGTHIP